MKIALVGSRWFGAEMLKLLRAGGHDVVVTATNGADALATAAEGAGLSPVILDGPRRVTGADIPADAVDVIVAAHTHAFVTQDARDKARIAAIGYHPSLLPRHRGLAAVEWTIKERDPIAGGSVYHLSGGMDAGALAAQDWCFVYPEDDAASLWRRALAPLGLRLLTEVVAGITRTGQVEARPQDERAATLAPALEAHG